MDFPLLQDIASIHHEKRYVARLGRGKEHRSRSHLIWRSSAAEGRMTGSDSLVFGRRSCFDPTRRYRICGHTISGDFQGLKRADFKRFAATAGIPAAAADTAMDELIAALARGLEQLARPPPLTDGSVGADRAALMREIVGERLHTFE